MRDRDRLNILESLWNFFFFYRKERCWNWRKENASLIIYKYIYIYISPWFDILDSILDSWRGEWNFVNLAKIVRHFLYIFYRVCRGRQRKESFLSWKLLHRVEKDWFFGGYIIERDNSINSSRVLEASLWRARLLARLENRVRENSRITMVEKFMITTTLYYGQSYTIPVQCIVTVFTIALMVINDNC